MGNEQHAQFAIVPQGLKQVEQLCLDGDIERAGGLVGDEHLRFGGEGDGNRNTLTQSP